MEILNPILSSTHASHGLVRPCTEADVDFVVSLLEQLQANGSFFHGYQSIDRQGMSQTLGRICRSHEMRRITKRGLEFVPADAWVSEEEGRAVACLVVANLEKQGHEAKEAYMVAVAPQYTGRGLGSRLLQFFCDHYRAFPLYAQCYPAQTTMQRLLERFAFHLYGKTKAGNLLYHKLPLAVSGGTL